MKLIYEASTLAILIDSTRYLVDDLCVSLLFVFESAPLVSILRFQSPQAALLAADADLAPASPRTRSPLEAVLVAKFSLLQWVVINCPSLKPFCPTSQLCAISVNS
jgi:hypothetical protein